MEHQVADMQKGIWITWENQRRNSGIAEALGWPLVQVEVEGKRLWRYGVSAGRTFSVIARARPEVIVVQNPSLALALFALALRRLFRFFLVVDAHNAGIYPHDEKYRILMWLSRMLQRHADLTIVTNQRLVDIVMNNGGRAFVLPDKVPEVPPDIPVREYPSSATIVFITSFSSDEPFERVFEAAGMLPSDVLIYCTGKYQGRVDPSSAPANVKFLGFVGEEEFWSHLVSCDCIMDLTFRENCLVCGAYEAVAVGKPLILSDTEALKQYFSAGCVYVKPTAGSIAQGIRTALQQRESLRNDMIRLRQILDGKWKNMLQDFESHVVESRAAVRR